MRDLVLHLGRDWAFNWRVRFSVLNLPSDMFAYFYISLLEDPVSPTDGVLDLQINLKERS